MDEARVKQLLEKLEWSSTYVDGTGVPMFSPYAQGTSYPACPCCGGANPKKFTFKEPARGHKKNCELNNILKELK